MYRISTKKNLYHYYKLIKEKTIVLVPTMGNLHEGHLSLIDLAKKKGEKVVVSIFVNPLQFSPKEDFASYPRTMDKDLSKLQDRQVDFVFYPDFKMIGEFIFPNSTILEKNLANVFSLQVPAWLANPLCGKSRPHFFHGVASIVFRLFLLLKPQVAIFGEKDYQQFLVIKKMIKDFRLPIKLFKGKTIRDKNGLALSSRNNYLNKTQRENAGYLYQSLQDLKKQYQKNGLRDFKLIQKKAKQNLKKKGIELEYLDVRDELTLSLLKSRNDNHHGRIFIAAKLGDTRLIDNLKI